MNKFVIPLLATFAILVVPATFTHALDISVDTNAAVTSNNDMMRADAQTNANATMNMRGKFQERRDDMMQKRAENRDDMQMRMKDHKGMMLDAREDRGMRFTTALSMHVQRLTTIAAKISARADLENNATAKAEVSTAKTDLSAASAAIGRAKAAIESTYASIKAEIEAGTRAMESKAPEMRADIKVELKAALDSFKSAHMHLKAAVEAFKKSDTN